jgi:hypothetical protein
MMKLAASSYSAFLLYILLWLEREGFRQKETIESG